jgi:nudix-type nucleoside diphosphatase (YffH/AdpP family)
MKTIAKLDTLYEGWSKFLLAHVRLSDGTIIKRQVEDHGRAVVVLPYDPARRTAILVRQFRVPVYMVTEQQDLLEVIAGIVDEDDIAAAARREAEEEAGLTLAHMEHVGCFFSIPGISTERVDYFLAEYDEASRTGAGGGLAEEHEEIEVIEMPLAELAALADNGALQDVKVFTLVQTLRLKRPELFAEGEKNGHHRSPGRNGKRKKRQT